MSRSLVIEGQLRPADAKPNALRRNGKIPAVLYGPTIASAISLVVDTHAAELLVRDARPQKTPIQLSIPDLPWQGTVVLQEVQAHPAKDTLYHLSFLAKAEN
ncbi:MAG: 50S ribosomal protein L25 [Thermosynechococcus sp.]|uniref:50S ribosomal protein L25 n=1 Tax=Thermosynechococcus sp. TaxID=2814275 RepID=UPI00220F0EEC|nr:50S ribosomal protein L25 [Thermosynechococcus sp.]BCX12781.1 MAG: 50S ribosomal protein L25 [Thermosynechococcus sp.]